MFRRGRSTFGLGLRVITIAGLAAALALQPTGAAGKAVAGPLSGVDTGMLRLHSKGGSAGTDNVQPHNCAPILGGGVGSTGPDDFLEDTIGLYFNGGLECNFELESIDAFVLMVDRSPDFNGESFEGRMLGYAAFHKDRDSAGYTWGQSSVTAHLYNGGRWVEPRLEVHLWAMGSVWDPCGTWPGLIVYVCNGVGTDTLDAIVGSGIQQTPLTEACRDQRGPVDAEMARIPLTAGGSTPASTRLIRLVSTVLDDVTRFKRDLCGVRSAAEAITFVTARGSQLWAHAVSAAQSSVLNDDRPLYWARLSMTTALRQWRPPFAPDGSAFEADLERNARGMTSDDFGGTTAGKVFVTGFDPFGLESGLLQGNPSGAIALRLDGTTIAGAEVQAVIFPVRYEDFNAGLVEQVVGRHLTAGSQQATMITTVSQGDVNFQLEYWNGRRRAAPAEWPPNTVIPDNRDLPPTIGIANPDGSGAYTSPVTPPVATGAEFVETNLPVDAMWAGAPNVAIDRSVVEKTQSGSPTSLPNGPSFTSGTIAVHGSGKGFLSNEIAYRVTRLRGPILPVASQVRAGHVHTPALSAPTMLPDPYYNSQRDSVVTQYQTILSRGISAI